MKFSIVFSGSGDLLEFTALSFEAYQLLEYYTEKLTKENNNYFFFHSNNVNNDPNWIDKKIKKLHNSIMEVNKHIYDITGELIDTFKYEDYLNQDTLNKLHADWVKSHRIMYKISDVLRNMLPDNVDTLPLGTILSKLNLSELYSEINKTIHQLEGAFNDIKFSTSNWISFNNSSPTKLITNDICNFRISFYHLGRTLYNKYQYFDTELQYDDENSFNEVLGYIDMNLVKPQTISLSPEYLSWCNWHNKIPTGNHLNIGNLINLESRLTDYRLIICRNMRSNNNFSINLNIK